MGSAISRYRPDARSARISLLHPNCFRTMRPGPVFRDLPQIITPTPFGASGLPDTRAFCTRAKPTALGILLFVLTGFPAAAKTNAKTILVLYSSGDRGVYNGVRELKSELKAVIPWPLDFYVEYLEGMRFGDKTYQTNLLEYLRKTYRGVKLDLVLTERDPALQFALSHRDKLFSGVPVVFFDVDTSMGWQPLGAGVTGVTAPVDVRSTIDLALHLHPNTNTVAVIIGDSPYERYWLAQMHSELLRHQDKVKEVDLVGLTAGQLFERSAAFPSQTVVLFEIGREESPQPAIGTFDFLTSIGQRLPTYSIFAWYCLGHEGIGGDSYDGYRELALLTPLVKRVLSGEHAESIPVVHDTEHHIVVDWRALQRWHIPESALPPGSVVEFKPPSAWEQYKWEIVGTLAFVALLLVLIAALLTNLIRRRRAEASLRRMAGQLLHAQDDERRRMARDLHDGAGPHWNLSVSRRSPGGFPRFEGEAPHSGASTRAQPQSAAGSSQRVLRLAPAHAGRHGAGPRASLVFRWPDEAEQAANSSRCAAGNGGPGGG
jgi:hypothetical protein